MRNGWPRNGCASGASIERCHRPQAWSFELRAGGCQPRSKGCRCIHRADRIRSLSNLPKESPHHEEDHRCCCCRRFLVRRLRPSPCCHACNPSNACHAGRHCRDAGNACCSRVGCQACLQAQTQARARRCQGTSGCEACFVLIRFDSQKNPALAGFFDGQEQLAAQRLGPLERGVNGAPPSRRGSGRGPDGRAAGAAARAPCDALPSRAGARGAWPPPPAPDRAGAPP